jgi:hypothetical protein
MDERGRNPSWFHITSGPSRPSMVRERLIYCAGLMSGLSIRLKKLATDYPQNIDQAAESASLDTFERELEELLDDVKGVHARLEMILADGPGPKVPPIQQSPDTAKPGGSR